MKLTLSKKLKCCSLQLIWFGLYRAQNVFRNLSVEFNSILFIQSSSSVAMPKSPNWIHLRITRIILVSNTYIIRTESTLALYVYELHIEYMRFQHRVVFSYQQKYSARDTYIFLTYVVYCSKIGDTEYSLARTIVILY